MLSKELIPGEFHYKDNIYLGHSSFNMFWFEELGIELRGRKKLILDIGSYDGGDGIRFKNYFGQNAEVYSFEMDVFRFKAIQDLKADINIKLRAIWNESKVMEYNISFCDLKDAGSTHKAGLIGGQCSLFNHTDFYKTTYPHIKELGKGLCEATTLKDLFEENYYLYGLDFVLAHIDIEGAEYEAIEGFKDIRPKLVYVETLEGMFEGSKNKNDLHCLLSGMGYRLVKDCISDRLYMFNQ